jgi:AhpD family alkylhydroperoxidase
MKEQEMAAEPLRMDLSKIAPDAYRHFLQLEGLVAQHVDRKILHLLKLRASQINGCAYCLAMHTDEALRDGEPVERLTLLDAWEESTLYSDKERAALAWVEEVTLIADSGASKDSFDALKAHFSEEEIGWLTVAATMINSWNRLAISSRAQYDRKMFAHSASAQKTPEHA